MKYSLEITPSAEKELHHYDNHLQERLFKKIFSLENNPRPFGCKKLAGEQLLQDQDW